jgi:hypothetical protein
LHVRSRRELPFNGISCANSPAPPERATCEGSGSFFALDTQLFSKAKCTFGMQNALPKRKARCEDAPHDFARGPCYALGQGAGCISLKSW